MRAFLRFAAFLWITPLLAALSMDEEVALRSCWSAEPAAVATSNFLTDVRMAVLIMRLRRFFFLFTLTRLMADLMFGNSVHLPAFCRQTPLYHAARANAIL